MLLSFILAAGAVAAPAPAADPKYAETAKTVLAAMDRTADPCQDFYRYACGGWLDSTQLPSDQNRWSRSFSEITERNRDRSRGILEELQKNPGDADGRRLADFYGACMDEAAVEKAGLDPLKPFLRAIDGLEEKGSLMPLVADLHRASMPAFFGLAVVGDFKNPDVNLGYLGQGGLGFPDRDYYLKDDETSKKLRVDYEAHVARMFVLAGSTPEAAAKSAASILAFETEIAKVQRPRVELRDPNKTYNKIDRKGLKEITPELDWDAYFKATGYPGVQDLNVQSPDYVKGLRDVLAAADLAVVKDYLRWGVLRSNAPLLSKAFVDENFAFYGKRLGGQQENQARWKRCVAATDGALGDLLGKKFVDRYFAGDSKKIAREMIDRIETAFAASLPGLAWMDETTRTRALDKKAALGKKIGYTEKWEEYPGVKTRGDDFFGNTMAVRNYVFDREAKKIGKPVDRTRFGMTPPTVNAYYTPLLNEIVFPAGILQPPFFSKDFPMAMNFGGIGMVMGHELSHGFDDSGRKFDPKGRLAEWWAPEVATKFEERASCVADLYSSYEPQPGLHMNGRLGLGENIADLGGIKQAYAAYKSWEKDNPGQAPAVPGLTNDQLLFVAFAQGWCTIATPEQERNQIITGPHSLPKYRVIGPVSNSRDFSAAFQCAEGTPMNPVKKCEVW
jgi:predicted metalloendopeptidase